MRAAGKLKEIIEIYSNTITKDEYGYAVSGVINLTEDIGATAAYIPYACENSLRKSWIIEE